MKSAFVATSFKHRHVMQDILTVISQQLTDFGYSPLVFVQQYHFAPDETQQMMQTSMRHIANCDLFIAELTHKVVGVGIEAGYAHAFNKPIVYIRQIDAKPSTTLTGIASYQVVYMHNDDLSIKLRELLTNLSQTKSS